MHDMGIFWLRAATVLYALGLVHALVFILRKSTALFYPALAAFAVGVVLQFVAIVEITTDLGHIPVDNFYETSSLCALIIALLFMFVYTRYRFTSLSVCVFPLVFLMTAIGSTETPVPSWPNTSIRDSWLLIHVVMVLLGYAALLLTAFASLFYLIQERQIKIKRPNSFFDRLPPLATLDDLITTSMGYGFAFITLGVIAGSAWAFIESGTSWIGDPKIAISLITWAFYLVLIFLRASAGLRGRKAALLTLAVLCCSALTWAAHIGLRPLIAK